MLLRRAGALVALATAASASLAAQRAERAVPSAYAITNARLVPVSAPTIARGTIVVRDGLITAVGANVAVPADARVIDGAGLTVYPGFIDSYGTLGLPSPAAARGGAGGGGVAAVAGAAAQRAGSGPSAPSGAPNSSYPLGLQPEVAAVDLLRPDEEAMSGPHGAGITAALTAPNSGIFQGQSALINLAGEDVSAMVVRAPVAQHIGFTPMRTGSYPNSLLGVFSSLRQMLLDAQHYRDEQAAYARNPRGLRRPARDPSLEAIQPVLSRQQPVVMYATTQREIERALSLAKEFNLRVMIAGGGEAWMIADRLRAENVPVLLSANFPRRTSEPSPDADPDPVRVLRERVEAPRTPAKLAKAGVRFAFQSGGMSSWSDFLANVRRASAEGLGKDQAIRALTLTPAELLGVGDRLGSLEAGKIANLTITRGDVLDSASRVTQLFIDGRPYEVRAPAAGAAAGARGAARGGRASGAWTVTVTLEGEDHPVTLTLRQEGDRLTGSLQGSLGSAEIAGGSIGAEGEFRFTASVTLKEGTEEATFTGTQEGNSLRGTVTIVGHAAGTFAGTRPGREDGAPPARPRTPSR